MTLMRRSIFLLATAVIVAIPQHLPAAELFELAITGAADASFAGTCTLTTAAGDHTLELSGQVPLRRTIQAESLVCRFETVGRVVVEVTRGNSRSRSATHGGVISVAVH